MSQNTPTICNSFQSIFSAVRGRALFMQEYLCIKDGQNIRTSEQLKIFAERRFAKVEIRHCSDLLRIPYDHSELESQPSVKTEN